MSEKVKKCELCEEQPATVLCSECCKCYCDECGGFVHSRNSLKGHKTEAIPEGVVVDARCPLHNDALRMFCVDEVKLCCGICRVEDLHKGHSVVKVTDIAQDNEVFSASDVRKRFADVLKSDDELDKKIEEAIESIRREGNEAGEKVKQTFIDVHKRLEEEEAKIMEELERVCNESEDVLQRNLDALKIVRESSKALNEVDAKGKEFSRLMKLNLVSSMEEQRRTMEELHRTMMTDLKIGWDVEGRKLSFTRTLFNGAPIPNSISFPSTSTRGMDISWDCDLSRMSEEDKRKVTYVVEVKKGTEEERGWREVYSGNENKCDILGLKRDTEYNVRVKCVIGGLQGRWSDVVSVKTKKTLGCFWMECPNNVEVDKKYSVDVEDPRIATKISGDDSYCTIVGNTPFSLNTVASWKIKVLKSKNNNGDYINVGVASTDINQNDGNNYNKCGWYLYCGCSTLWSGPPHNYKRKEYGPRKRDGEYVHTGDSVGVVMDTTKGELSFVLNDVNLGVAYEGIPLDKPLVPCVVPKYEGDSVELIF